MASLAVVSPLQCIPVRKIRKSEEQFPANISESRHLDLEACIKSLHQVLSALSRSVPSLNPLPPFAVVSHTGSPKTSRVRYTVPIKIPAPRISRVTTDPAYMEATPQGKYPHPSCKSAILPTLPALIECFRPLHPLG